MNNKGQAFVLFVLLLPIILLLFSFVVDIGMMSYNKKSIDMKIEEIIENGLVNNLKEDEIQQLLTRNIGNVENINIIKNNDSLEINIKVKLKTIFENTIKQNRYEVTYIGKIIEEKINIVRK